MSPHGSATTSITWTDHPCPGDVRKHPLEDLALLQAIEEGIHTSDGDYEIGPTDLHDDSVEHFRIVVEPED